MEPIRDLPRFGLIFAFIVQHKTKIGSFKENRLKEGHENSEGHDMTLQRDARFAIGDVVRHRMFPFRGVIFDVDPEFANTEEWWQAIPEAIRPRKDQPFYHVLAENEDSYYTAYVSEQNLLPDATSGPVRHPQTRELFEAFDGERYTLKPGDLKPN